MNLDLYEEVLRWHGTSVFRGEFEDTIRWDDPLLQTDRVTREFVENDEWQEMTLCSSSLGLVYTFSKVYRKWEAP